MRILVLGAAGLLGNAIFRVLNDGGENEAFGTIRSQLTADFFTSDLIDRLVLTGDLEDVAELTGVLDRVGPDIVVNCTGLARSMAENPQRAIALYSLFPHRLSLLCKIRKMRVVHISTDAVFSGARGGYSEEDIPDASDLYGISKLLGELHEPHTLSIRTSLIGPELKSKQSLLEWFLSQDTECSCYARAIFSGLPSVVLAKIVRDIVLVRTDLFGIYHIAARPISKCDLLRLIARQYNKTIRVHPDYGVVIDRSLSARRFHVATGFEPPEWSELVRLMHEYSFGLARK